MTEEKLLYLMNHYSPRGATHFGHLVELLESLADQGVQILLLIEKAQALPAVRSPRIEVQAMPPDVGGFKRWIALVMAVASANRRGYRTVFVRISAWSALAALAASAFGRGRVFYWQSGTTIEFDRAQPFNREKAQWLLRTWLPSKLVWRLCHRFVTGPSSMLEYYATEGKVSRRRLRLLHNDVDHRRFRVPELQVAQIRDAMRVRLEVRPTTIVLLFVHRLSPVRRTLQYLPGGLERVRAADPLMDVVLVFAGGGPDEDEMRCRFVEAGLRDHVRFLGDVPNMGIEQLYAAADVFIQPSHAEGFPRSLLEAMVAGLPIATTDAGGTAELLGPAQQSFVSPKDDPEAFGEVLVALLARRNDWTRLAEENRQQASAYDTPKVAQMYREVLFHE